MTRKDYELIAKSIRAERQAMQRFNLHPAEEAGANRIAYKLAAALASTNPRFDTKRFLAACGIAH